MLKLLILAIANSRLSLKFQLRLLRVVALIAWRKSRIQHWAKNHPKIAIDSNWCSQAWWGVVAGCIVRRFLNNPSLKPEALALLEPTDWSELDSALAEGGVIVATAHLGPPKFLMNVMLERQMPLLVWTNLGDFPAWLSQSPNATFLDPLPPAERGVLLVKSALHLRRGGILLGAADTKISGHSREVIKFDHCWHLSPGLPALAFKLNVPTFFVLAQWHGNRIRIKCQRMEVSYNEMTDEQWQQAWLDRYWSELEKLITSRPENLRFLRNIDDGRFLQDLGL